ncbi:hypothetical protein OIU84_029078 [Salix udensis]|uniref:Uncharacterized protein n=1 Tax=Salix udensis TaxID=889485 RepID=A0AAD6KDZ9_9ROSI|nr:hypothetical protein OIU84_029078 [Salix udensis]
MSVDEGGSGSLWTREQDKAFENALATYPEDTSDRWEKIAADVPEGSTGHAGDEGTGKKGGHLGHHNSESNHGSKASRSDQERRKGIAWTEDEHR